MYLVISQEPRESGTPEYLFRKEGDVCLTKFCDFRFWKSELEIKTLDITNFSGGEHFVDENPLINRARFEVSFCYVRFWKHLQTQIAHHCLCVSCLRARVELRESGVRKWGKECLSAAVDTAH